MGGGLTHYWMMWCTYSLALIHRGILFGYFKQEGSVVDPGPDPSIKTSKKSKENLDFYYFLLLFYFLPLKTDVKMPSKSNKQKPIKPFFVCILSATDEKNRIRIRIRNVSKWYGTCYSYYQCFLKWYFSQCPPPPPPLTSSCLLLEIFIGFVGGWVVCKWRGEFGGWIWNWSHFQN